MPKVPKLENSNLAIEGKAPTNRSKPGRVLIRNLVFLVSWTTAFTLAYAQSPLYTSNQNQYFLHGLAKAGLGFLNEDWLANTLDPTPVFSKLIEISWRALPWQPIFYIYFGLLAGIFLFSLLGIANQLWTLEDSRPRRWLYLSSLVVLFSAGLRYLGARILGINWEYIFDGGVAGQRLLGTVFQPSTFGVFLILSIYLFLLGKRGWAIVALLLATSFHPTYLFSAGILTALYMGITFWETRDARAPLALGVAALIGVSPILWHTLATFGGTSAELSTQARKILVEFRIPHHAVVTEWFDVTVLVKVAFVGFALILLHRGKAQVTAASNIAVTSSKKLFHIILWPSVMAIALTLVQVFTSNVMLALLFPWRFSSWLVPLSIGILVGWGVYWLFERFRLERYSHWVIAASLIVTIGWTALGIAKFQFSWQAKQALSDRAMMAYVETYKQSSEVYLIPLKMQDFRLETGAPAFVEFKSIPYKDVDVLEWRRRVELVNNFFTKARCKQILDFAQDEGITHLILTRDHPARHCNQVSREYRDEYYGVYIIQEP